MSIQQNLAGSPLEPMACLAVGSPLEPMACLAVGSRPDSGSEYGFHLMQQDINPAKEWLVTPMPSYCCSFRGSQLGKMIIFLLQSHVQQFLAQWKLAGYFSQTRCLASSLDPLQFPSLASTGLELHAAKPGSHMGGGDLDSGCYVCSASTLLAEPSPQPTELCCFI